MLNKATNTGTMTSANLIKSHCVINLLFFNKVSLVNTIGSLFMSKEAILLPQAVSKSCIKISNRVIADIYFFNTFLKSPQLSHLICCPRAS